MRMCVCVCVCVCERERESLEVLQVLPREVGGVEDHHGVGEGLEEGGREVRERLPQRRVISEYNNNKS